MARILGVDGLTLQDVEQEVAAGARFVQFQYCISVILMIFRRGSNIYFVRVDDSVLARSLGFTLVSLVLGWWGIPWGPIYTVEPVVSNLGGGKDITADVLGQLRQRG